LKTLTFPFTWLVLCLALTNCVQHHYKPVAPVVEPKAGAAGAPLQEFLSECLKGSRNEQRQLRLRDFEGKLTLEISYFTASTCEGSASRKEILSGPFNSVDSPGVYKLDGNSPGALISFVRVEIEKYQATLSDLKPSSEQATNAELNTTLARLSPLDAAADYWVGATQTALTGGDFDPARYHSRYCRHHVEPAFQNGKMYALTITLQAPCKASPFVFSCEGPICRYNTNDIITILGPKSYRYFDNSTRSQVEFKLFEF
jgi:hypothetical protein